MFRPLFPLLAVFLAALLALGACTRRSEEKKPGGKGEELPLTEYHDTTILDMHDGSRQAWRLTTTHLVRWPGAALVNATPVDFVMFDSLGKRIIHVTADSGAVDEGVTFLLAKGNVFGRSAKGMELRTDSLRWNKTLNQVNTEARVRVVSENGDILTGKGFTSDANLDHWQILSEVKGVFQQAGERTGELDATSPGGL
jgi:LPS export ABC transporter protein LptC